MPLPEVGNASQNRDGLYIGRAFAGFAASPFLNPFSVGEDTPDNRKVAVWKFLLKFLDSPQRFELDQLRAASRLVCWCAPKLCHGHALVWLLEHQAFREPCPKCGEMLTSRMNVHVHNPESALVYEQGACKNPRCLHYRFRHTAFVDPDTIPKWVAARIPAPSPEPTLL